MDRSRFCKRNSIVAERYLGDTGYQFFIFIDRSSYDNHQPSVRCDRQFRITQIILRLIHQRNRLPFFSILRDQDSDFPLCIPLPIKNMCFTFPERTIKLSFIFDQRSKCTVRAIIPYFFYRHLILLCGNRCHTDYQQAKNNQRYTFHNYFFRVNNLDSI